MAAFFVRGSNDEARGKLKAHLEAREAKFNAALKGMLKSPSEPPRAPAAPPAAQPASTGSMPATNRNHSEYSRLRTEAR
jgi:hypothetical protein